MESILTSVKKLLGITPECTNFDSDIIMHINSVFLILNQIGVGPSKGYRITDEFNTWDEFIPEDNPRLEAVKSYMYMKVKLLFDPPSNSSVMESTNRLLSELEWRIYTEVDKSSNGEEESQNESDILPTW